MNTHIYTDMDYKYTIARMFAFFDDTVILKKNFLSLKKPFLVCCNKNQLIADSLSTGCKRNFQWIYTYHISRLWTHI